MNDLPVDIVRVIASRLGVGDAARLSACSTSLAKCITVTCDEYHTSDSDAKQRVDVILDCARRANEVDPSVREELLERMGAHSKKTGVRFGRCFGSGCLTTQNVSGFLGGRYWVAMWLEIGGRDASIITAFERGASITFTKEIGADTPWSSNAWSGRSPDSTLPADATKLFEESMGPTSPCNPGRGV